ncbi:cytochrome c [Pelomicrobium methylotrophicum]|uniref:Cytochrome c n=1 Tax=Pelomicrobium methylotrophicum TaxID=2602750 RepID=A0A5C7EQI7_9PROT|nr:cytochrome c [Pelomicrobium methylotrophicum]TXF10470.1 cytochrome c [Pelomicrobium methylotrophicum]
MIKLYAAALTMAALLAAAWPMGAARAEEKKLDPAAFARGAKAWADNCSRCHNVRDPKELRDDQWKPVVTHMRIRAGLTGQEARDILLFLQGSN